MTDKEDPKKVNDATPGQDAAGGLDEDDVWGDVEDPMAELEGMNDEQIQSAIKEMESQIRREKNEFTNSKKKTDELNRRLKENREKLKLNT